MTSDAGSAPAPKRAKVEEESKVEVDGAEVAADASAAAPASVEKKRSLISLPKGAGAGADASGSAAPDASVDVSSVFQAHVLEDAAVPSRRESFLSSAPYGHCVIDGLVDDALLREVREEVIGNLEATYKETDLFKMFQTGDLANLSGLDEASKRRLPALLRLRAALASPVFRDLARKVTGCGELSTVLDGAANVHADGGHLLCHDDVIGDRAVSFILYLVDPDAPWTAQDGGALELYPTERDDPTVPAPDPSASLLPKWNRLAMFAVQPGKSFHSIQEVTSGGRPRLSIQGWLHAAHVPEQAELATLKKLQEKQAEGGGDEGKLCGFAPGADEEEAKEVKEEGAKEAKEAKTEEAKGGPVPSAVALPSAFPSPPPASAPAGPLASEFTPSELSLLRAFVNPAYLREDVWAKVHAKFVEDGSVQLRAFLLSRLAQTLSRATLGTDRRQKAGAYEGWEKDRPDVPQGHPRPCPDYDLGVGGGWTTVGPAFKQRFLVYDGEADLDALLSPEDDQDAQPQDPGRLLAAVRDALFGSTAFAKLLKKARSEKKGRGGRRPGEAAAQRSRAFLRGRGERGGGSGTSVLARCSEGGEVDASFSRGAWEEGEGGSALARCSGGGGGRHRFCEMPMGGMCTRRRQEVFSEAEPPEFESVGMTNWFSQYLVEV